MKFSTKTEKMYVLELTPEEMNALRDMIGNTSSGMRQNDLRLTQNQSDIISNIFNMMIL